MHVHVSALAALITFCYVILSLFVMRWVAAQWPDSPIGKAMAALN